MLNQHYNLVLTIQVNFLNSFLNNFLVILDVDVLIYDPDLIKCEFTKHLSQKNDETLYSFVPEKPGKYLISLSKNGVALDDWPFFVSLFIYLF